MATIAKKANGKYIKIVRKSDKSEWIYNQNTGLYHYKIYTHTESFFEKKKDLFDFQNADLPEEKQPKEKEKPVKFEEKKQEQNEILAFVNHAVTECRKMDFDTDDEIFDFILKEAEKWKDQK